MLLMVTTGVAYVKRIVDRTEIASEHLLGVTLGTGLTNLKVGIRLLEVMIADELEESQSMVLDAFHVLRIDVHIVKHYVAERHSHRRPSGSGKAVRRMEGMVSLRQRFYVVGIENLRVVIGYVMETVRTQSRVAGGGSVAFKVIGDSLSDGDVIARSYAVLLWQTILAVWRWRQTLLTVVSVESCHAPRRSVLQELTSVVLPLPAMPLPSSSTTTPFEHQRPVSRLTAHQTHKQQ